MLDLLENINSYFSISSETVSSVNHAFIQIKEICVSGSRDLEGIFSIFPAWLSDFLSVLAVSSLLTKVFRWR